MSWTSTKLGLMTQGSDASEAQTPGPLVSIQAPLSHFVPEMSMKKV